MTTLSTHTRRPLSRLRIAQAALAIVDRDGLEALSMRRLGAELGVEGMAIYRHFPNKAAVLAGVVEVLLGELVIPPPSDVAWTYWLPTYTVLWSCGEIAIGNVQFIRSLICPALAPIVLSGQTETERDMRVRASYRSTTPA